ncbi:MAG TPA: PAS domain-containing sensor histidine kinase [Polyangiaceae bacterium]|nr:PAS domain-containing sensor histidine kinase [Polyangiaceae bacterium]
MTLEAEALDIYRAVSQLAFADGILGMDGTGLLAFDAQFRYLFWNRAMERMSGMMAAEVVGKCAFDLFPFLDQTGERTCYEQALAGQTITAKERRYVIAERGLDGYYDASYGPLTTTQGTVVGGMAVVRNITRRKIAEEHIRETEYRFRTMADVAPVLLWMSDGDGLCTFFNQTWLDFTGRTLEEEWGVGWAEGIHFEDFQRCIDTYSDAFNARETFEMEYRLRRHDGAYRWILDRGTVRYTPDGSFAGYIGSCIDITDRKQMESDLKKAVRDRDDFLSIASHELRTPLTTLQLEIEGLKRTIDRSRDQHPMSARVIRSADVAARQTNRLIALVEELLDVSRVASGRLKITPVELDMCELLRDLVHRMAPTVEQAHCSISLETTEPKIVGRWDRTRLDQVVVNLVSNAVKYGAGKPIQVSAATRGDEVLLRVRDHGIGVALADQGRIFQRFERAVSTSNYGGFGLGLWISREILAAHGGRVELESEPGRGATFIVSLPRDAGRGLKPG